MSGDIEIVRNDQAQPKFSLLDDMYVERGSRADWDVLHNLHYKASALPSGPHYWRCVTSSGDLIGVVVFCPVSLLHAVRHKVFPRLKPGHDTKFTNTMRAAYLNKYFTRAARIVTDTQYRGVGVSYRMVNLAMRMEGLKYVEIVSSMAKFNPFDIKAGFRHAHLRNNNAYEKGIAFFRKHFTEHPADHAAIMGELAEMSPKLREATIQAVRDFYYKNSPKEKTGKKLGKGTARVDGMSTSYLLKEVQQLVFASPAYGIWKNPDLDQDIPDRLPLSAFDLQAPTEPLRLDLL